MSKLVIDQNPERECWTNTYIYESKYIYGDKRSKQIHIWRHIHTRQMYSTRKLTERTWSHWHAIAKKKFQMCTYSKCFTLNNMISIISCIKYGILFRNDKQKHSMDAIASQSFKKIWSKQKRSLSKTTNVMILIESDFLWLDSFRPFAVN